MSPRSARKRRLELQRLKKHKSSASIESSVARLSSKPRQLEPPAVGLPVQKSCPSYGFKSVCGRREDMKDGVSVHPHFFRKDCEGEEKWDFYGIFDWRGCSQKVMTSNDRIHEIVAKELEGIISLPPLLLDWKGVMERSFHRMEIEAVDLCGTGCTAGPMNFGCQFESSKCEHVGSTAIVAVVDNDCIVVTNRGDSRAVLCRSGTPVPLSVDHKWQLDCPDELLSEGARVLGVSRAIVPEVTVTERSGDDECLILASVGLWDVVTDEKACDTARMCLWSNETIEGYGNQEMGGTHKGCFDAALLLTELALAEQSTENVSVVVVDLRKGKSF